MYLFRVRILLEITGRVPKLFPFHAPLVHALVAEANGLALGARSAFPAGVIPHAPEQLRVHLGRGDRYAFGLSLFDSEPGVAGERLELLVRGLRQLGARKSANPRTLEGNFRVAELTDLFGGRPVDLGKPLVPLPPEQVLAETQAAARLSRVTFRFHTPLRWQLPRAQKTRRHDYMTRENFQPELLLKRIPTRLKSSGLDTSLPFDEPDGRGVEMVENRLVWLDVDYGGGRKKGLKLSGVVGRIVLELPEDYPRHWLVWGQYVHLGEATRFGHGAYRLEELGPDPYPVERAGGLLDLALRKPVLDLVSANTPIAAGELAQAATQIRLCRYQPAPPQTVWLERAGAEPRRLAIPTHVDRALQRAVYETLAPGLDSLFETSSFAYRRGLGRHAAARHLARSYEAGFRWAVKADFSRFFDSVEHTELRARLDAYLADRQLVDLLMDWVEAADDDGNRRGLPTGAPISPLLANLFLDRFDERVAATGGRLVPYADDFLILFRDQQEAEERLAQAQELAAQLKLSLNGEKTSHLDLSEPFEFLGFRFELRGAWQTGKAPRVQHLDELGWIDLARHRPAHAPKVRLPGESAVAASQLGTVCVLDSKPVWVGAEAGQLQTQHKDGSTKAGPPFDRIEQILVVGKPTLDATLFPELREHRIPLVVADAQGRPVFDWLPDETGQQADELVAQVRGGEDESLRLAVARELVAAKLTNYAQVAQSYPDRRKREPIAPALYELAEQALAAEGLDELLGYEGAGAAKWYRQLAGRLPKRFHFRRRVAPRAHDPVNVMLNIAHTHLYRQAKLACRLVGLSPMLGMLHRPRAGFAALAADLQEPFRMLMDRAVLEAAHRVSPRDFEKRPDGPYPLRISVQARRRLLGTVQAAFTQPVAGAGDDEPVSYRVHLIRLARSFRRRLIDHDAPLDVFRYRSGEQHSPGDDRQPVDKPAADDSSAL